MTAIGHVSIFLSDKDGEQLVAGTHPDWLVRAAGCGDRASACRLSHAGGGVRCGCSQVRTNLPGAGRFLAAGGKMKLNDSKNSALHFLLSIKEK